MMNQENLGNNRDLILEKPLCILDLETTGTRFKEDRIVQIAIIKLAIDRSQPDKEYNQLINPLIPIPQEASQVHKITDEMVLDKPTFQEKATEIFDFINGCDLCGFSIQNFDLKLLTVEFDRVGFDLFHFRDFRVVDVKNIFHVKEPRTLTAALKFYCNKAFENAHDALHDVRATKEVLLGQLKRYPDLEANVEFLEKNYSPPLAFLDKGFQLYEKNGEAYFGFGSHKDKKIKDVLRTNPGYIDWMYRQNFHKSTMEIIEKHR
ncbi:MAG: 3'-5' exonuclease [Flavobacteriaceae bacterium]|nr:3'-5' exonuclease [Flavobacteriaceae bacterium]MCY4267219.1 3'-5' exonuclease [Flavobacteriaceae bacterium]